MRRWTARRVGLPVTLSLMVSALALGSVSSSAADQRLDLPRTTHGEAALRLLGGRLDVAAAVNDTTSDKLAELLRSDPTAWMDRSGAVFFKDPPAPGSGQPVVDDMATAPLSETFALHSLPGAELTIFLDVDGASASATGWHASYPSIPTTQPAWDPAGNGASFTEDELRKVQTVWQVVAEDYAPFDVDVTTADPGPGAIHRTSSSDTRFGSHVVITPSAPTQVAICPGGCGGVAYINVFDAVLGSGGDGYGYRQPAWVFPHQLGGSAKNVGEAASHEAGHNLGLSHDANGSAGYDSGHGSWAPIMGSGYSRPITQWSQGSYDGATNQQDDVAMIGAVVGLRADEAPSTVAGAPLVPAGSAYISGRTDVDTYILGSCSGTVTVTATAPAFADLDVRVSLHDAAGAEVSAAAPASGTVDASTASGLGAALSYAAAPGVYYASVDGVGDGPWSTGYDDYGSLGAYTLSSTGCVAPKATTTALTATADGRSAQLSATVSAAGAAPAGTVEFRDADALVGTSAVAGGTATLTTGDLTTGQHAFRARFVPASIGDFTGSESAVVASLVVAFLPTTGTVPAPAPAPAPATTTRAASATRIVAPTKARAGSRPKVTITVTRGATPVAGRVVVAIGGKKKLMTLAAGRIMVRLPRLKGSRVTISARFVGDTTTAPSTASRTIKVRRRR